MSGAIIMGGRALLRFGIESKRISSDEYRSLSKEIKNILNETKHNIIPSHRDKETFGDMDIVYTGVPFTKESILELFPKTKALSKNGNVLSLEYKDFQIDLIYSSREYFESSLNYASFPDLGNLIGRIFHKIGAKYGHRGLDLIIRLDENQHVLSEINLTKSIDEILPLIGLSVEKFKNGFDSLEDIFQYVASSSFFDPDIYLFHNRNHKSKIRDKKRMAYNRFLEWIKSQNPPAHYHFPEKSERGGYNIREPFYSEIIVPAFPWIEEFVAKMITSFELRQELKKIYNGKIVSEMTGLSGKELGVFMKKYGLNNSIWSDEEISYWIKNKVYLFNLVAKSFENHTSEI